MSLAAVELEQWLVANVGGGGFAMIRLAHTGEALSWLVTSDSLEQGPRTVQLHTSRRDRPLSLSQALDTSWGRE